MTWLFGSAPTPPNPVATAAGQTATNIGTAQANTALNNMNQVTPYGSLTYDNTQAGNYQFLDATTGNTWTIPRWTATQTLSPAQQNIANLGQQTQTNLGQLASNQSSMLQGLLGSPYDPSRGQFDAQRYLQQNPDVMAAAQAARNTTFDPQAYLAAYPDVAQYAANTGQDPIAFARQHYQEFGQNEGRTEGFGHVDPAEYAANHYRTQGMLEGRASGGPIAPRAGDPNSLSGYSLTDSYGDPNDKQLRDFDSGGAITRDYGPADGFSADRLRVEQAMYERMAPQLERDRQRMAAQLRDQGNLAGGEAYGAENELFNKKLTDARLGITAQGGQEQKLLNDMAAQRAGFQNAAQKQAFEQSQGRATFANAAQQQDFTQQGLRAQFLNQAQGQRMAMAQAKLDAENKARAQFLSEQYAQRQAPINEITALMSGSQVQQPTWANTASSQIPTTDYAGLTNNRFSQDMANYQQSSQNFNQIMGGIFGAVSGLTRSDRREKDVGPKLGTIFAAGPDGERPLPIHEYKYKDDPAAISHVGPMAQDVEKVDRGAVKTIAGTKYIDMTRMGSILRDKKEARHGR